LRTHRHVQRRQRFVGDNDLRAQDQRAGQSETLFLARGQHVGVIADMVGQETYQTQGFDNPFATRFRLQVGIQPQREIQNLRNTLARVEGR
jgi:hypothetical protein